MVSSLAGFISPPRVSDAGSFLVSADNQDPKAHTAPHATHPTSAHSTVGVHFVPISYFAHWIAQSAMSFPHFTSLVTHFTAIPHGVSIVPPISVANLPTHAIELLGS